MSVELIAMRSDPKEPIAGSPFRLVVEVMDAPSADTTVLLEKQRIVPGLGGSPVLGSIEVARYFSLAPKPIVIRAGSKTGTSDPIEVLLNPQAPAGDPPVKSPEHLLFSARFSEEPFKQFLIVSIRLLEGVR